MCQIWPTRRLTYLTDVFPPPSFISLHDLHSLQTLQPHSDIISFYFQFPLTIALLLKQFSVDGWAPSSTLQLGGWGGGGLTAAHSSSLCTVAASVPCFNSHLISLAQIRRAPMPSQLVFICRLISASLQNSARAGLQLFIKDLFLGKGATEKVEHGGKGGRKSYHLSALPCIFSSLIICYGSDIVRKITSQH